MTRFFDDLRVGETVVLPDRRQIRQSDIDLYREYCGDWHGRWSGIFGTDESAHELARLEQAPDVAPGIFILSQQWGVSPRSEPLAGIVATYLLDEIRQAVPIRVGDSYTVRQDVLSLEPLPDGLGTVRTRRTLVRADGTEVFSLVERARWRTRARWERDQTAGPR